jgi:hypothetical protein
MTYLKSIINTESYKNREFILLNYNSKDEIDDWAKENLSDFIKLGLISYYKTEDPKYWIAAHAKNISQKLANGDLLCNLDCDNFLVPGYCEKIIEIFQEPNIILASDSDDSNGNNGCCGMIISQRKHFYSVNGYDENICLGWGMDDTNYQYRCRMQNDLKLVILDKKFTNCISHSNEIRTKNCQLKKIEFTKQLSINITHDCAVDKDYVANKDIHWGKAKLIKNFKEIIEI